MSAITKREGGSGRREPSRIASEGRRNTAGDGVGKVARGRKAAPCTPASSTTRTTKSARLIELLRNDDGIDIAALSSALGWQPHTTRAALTRLRHAGHAVESAAPPEGGSKRYRIVAAATRADGE